MCFLGVGVACGACPAGRLERSQYAGPTLCLMIDLTPAHDLVLLSLDPETGARRRRQQMDFAAAGALLAELALAERVALDGKKVEVVDPTPTGSRHADTLLATMALDKPRTPRSWVEKTKRGCVDDLLDDLVTAEVVRRDERRVLGVIPTRRYPQIGGARRDALLGGLRLIMVQGALPTDARTVILANLVVAAELHGVVFPGESKRRLKQRLVELDDAGWATEAVRKAIQAASSGATAAAAVGGGDGGSGGA